MKISGKVAQVIVKSGKDADIRFELSIEDADVIELVRWNRGNVPILLSVEPMQTALSIYDEELWRKTPTLERVSSVGFNIDGKFYAGTITAEGWCKFTGTELKLMASLPEDASICRVVEGSGDGTGPDDTLQYEMVVADDEVVEITDGMRFYSHCEIAPDDESAGTGNDVGAASESEEGKSATPIDSEQADAIFLAGEADIFGDRIQSSDDLEPKLADPESPAGYEKGFAAAPSKSKRAAGVFSA